MMWSNTLQPTTATLGISIALGILLSVASAASPDSELGLWLS
jgi:hypothetical protein